METIVAMDLGKFKSVVCYLNRGSLTTQYRTVRTCPSKFKVSGTKYRLTR
jgi:hypothetical protein